VSDRKQALQDWLDQIVEEPIDPDRPIVDPHHHLWRDRGIPEYLLEDLWRDTGSGHNVRKTVFVECRAEYDENAPEHLRSVGETRFVADVAAASARPAGQRARIAGIVAHTDLRAGGLLDEALAAHEEAAGGLLKGIRHAGARDPHPEVLMIAGDAPEGLYADGDFRRGMRTLGQRGLSYDTWHYHHQNRAFRDLARAVPDTIMVLDHFGTPLGVGPYSGQRESIFEAWEKDVASIAACDNVVAKLGGLAMPDNGFGWMGREKPPTSDEFVQAQRRYYLHMIDCFGPDRCMFESNFPVDKLSIAYPILWNGLKKIVAHFSEDEKDAMFRGTATRIYRLED
jgi:predicted TIM-barrel fold metal-dependent hydrolase